MLAFLTTIRHPEAASNLAELERLFELTATSVCGQTSRDFRLIVVCHQKPAITFSDERIHYHLVDWPVPVPLPDQKHPFSHKNLDHGLKLALGTLVARECGARWYFPVDADDWISSSVVEYVQGEHSRHGYIVDKGHFVNWRRLEYKRRRGLVNFCGSTYCPTIHDLFELLPQLGRAGSLPGREALLGSLPIEIFEEGFGAHKIPRYLAGNGKPMAPFPFFAAAWVMNNGENIYGSADGEHGRPIDTSFCRHYGLPASLAEPPRQASLMTSLGEAMSYGHACLEHWRTRRIV